MWWEYLWILTRMFDWAIILGLSSGFIFFKSESKWETFLMEIYKFGLIMPVKLTSTWKVVCTLVVTWVTTKAQFRRQTFHEPNLISLIKYMKSSASESVKNGYLNLEWLSRSFRLAHPGISPLERLWFGRRTFHVPNLKHKLLLRILQAVSVFVFFLQAVLVQTELSSAN